MVERNRPHILVNRLVEPEPYMPRPGGPIGASPPTPADPAAHSIHLREALETATSQATIRRTAAASVEGALDGIYVEFESAPGIQLALVSLDPQVGKSPPELRAVTERREGEKTVQRATVFIPDGSAGYFLKRFEQYVTDQTHAGNRKNGNLVDRIADIRLATLQALWTDPRSHFPEPDERVWWEVWLRRREGESDRLASFAAGIGARIGPHRLVFDDRLIVLVSATATQLGAALDVLDDIAELRRPAEALHTLVRLKASYQADLVADLVNRVDRPPFGSPRTCNLDTGVGASHPLIQMALDPSDVYTISPVWKEDSCGHGTMMAGLVLYPDLGTALLTNHRISLVTQLESVKILPYSGTNEDRLYGAIIAQATSLVEIKEPIVQRTFVLAVTAPGDGPEEQSALGQPTTWSSTIDALAAGRQVTETTDGLVYLDSADERYPRLFVISTGNVRPPYDIGHIDRSDTEPAEDPAQAWNALVVGAYTELRDYTDEAPFSGWKPLAPPGELSPFSRTSVSYKRQWRHAPDIVLEGGNAAVSPAADTVDTPPHLQILTTRSPSLGGRLLTTTSGTSAATAMAGNLIAQIRYRYPSLWPETVRALVVHSARWTPAMNTEGNKGDHRNAVRRYGWGVPDVNRALRSADDSVTLISQQTIRPYLEGKMREMHLHDLPWPTDELQNLGEARVELRVALSYFIEPNAARRGWAQRFRYASHGLRFEVRRPTEDREAFRKRLNKLALAEDERRPESAADTGEWDLGRERVRGSLHVDHWHGTAADLAARGCIAVYPVTGWWKEQPKRDRSESGARYSLVVSIETSEIEADIWTPVAVQAGIPITV